MNWSLKHILLSTVLLLAVIIVRASDTLQLDSIGDIHTFVADQKGHLFVADQHFTLYKLDAQGNEISRVNTKVYGAIYSIDCSNPFELYVFHKDQNILVFYDNMLNLRGELRLNELGLTNVGAVARSFDNGIWVLDLNAFEIKKLDKEGNTQENSGNLSAFNSQIRAPYALAENGQQLVLADSLTGFASFDLFANYSRFYSLGRNNAFVVTKDRLISLNGNELQLFAWDSFESSTHSLNHSPVEISMGMQQRLLLRSDNRIIRLGQ